MKSKKLISLLCVVALSASSFASLTAFAAQGDKIGSDLVNLNFNSTTNFAAADPADPNYDGVLANGTSTGSVTVPILADGTAVKTLGEGQTAALTVVTGSRANGDRGWYTDSEGALVKTGSYYSIEEKTAEDKYLHMSFPQFGDYTTNGRHAIVNFPATYTATAEKDYVVEFKARFVSGMNAGVTSTANPYNPVLRLGTFTAKPANAVEINKRDLEIGDDWVTVKAVTSLKGTKVYLNGSETYSATSTTTTSISGFGLYSEDGQSNIAPPLDVKGDSLLADKHTLTPVVDIDDLVIYEAEPEKEADITIKYVDANNQAITGKADVTLTGIVGKQFTAPASYKVNFNKDDDQYYTYTSGGDTPITISETAANNVITLKFTATDKPTVTFKGVCGTKELGTIGTAKGMPGEDVTSDAYAHAYMQDSDNKWYEKIEVQGGPRGNIGTYNLSAKVGSADSTVNVAYKPAYNVVEFIEAEDDETATADSSSTYSTNYPKLYASGGQWRKSGDAGDYVTGFYTSPVEKAGTYEITVRSYGPDKRSGAIGTLDREGKENKYAVKIAELTTEGINTTTATADLEEGNLFWVGKNSADMSSSKSTAKKMDEIDYIVVKDVNVDAAPVPEVTIGNISGYDETVQLTLTNSEEFLPLGINPKVTLIQAVYDGTTLSDVKVWNNIEISSQTGGVTAEISDAIFDEDSVFYVWDAVGGVRPLGAAKPYTAERI